MNIWPINPGSDIIIPTVWLCTLCLVEGVEQTNSNHLLPNSVLQDNCKFSAFFALVLLPHISFKESLQAWVILFIHRDVKMTILRLSESWNLGACCLHQLFFSPNTPDPCFTRGSCVKLPIWSLCLKVLHVWPFDTFNHFLLHPLN